MSNSSLMPSGLSALERRLAEACSGITGLNVPLRKLWNLASCPASFLPYLVWAFSVDRWDEGWAESVQPPENNQCQNINCGCTFKSLETVTDIIMCPGRVNPAPPHPSRATAKALQGNLWL